jgi:hypothetical protein
MTKQEKVAAWLTGLNCTQQSTANGYWHHPEVGYISPGQATFFYDVVQQARIEEIQLLIGTHNNDPSTKDYKAVRVTRELLNKRMDHLHHLKQEGSNT